MRRILPFFFFNDPATTEISPLPLHAARPTGRGAPAVPPAAAVGARLAPVQGPAHPRRAGAGRRPHRSVDPGRVAQGRPEIGRATRLNSSHANISYAVFCLKKKQFSCIVLTTQ